jgi:hypothetical protein
MAFRSHENNPVAELVELYANIHDTDTPDSFEMTATLQINPDEIDVGDYTIQVNILEAHLSVEAFGSTVDPHAKHGKRVHAESVPRTVTTDRSLKVAVSTTDAREAAADMSLSMIEASLKAGAKRQRSDTQSTDVSLSERQEKTTEHIPVEAVGNNRWKVSDEGDRPLQGYYLDNVRLCTLLKSASPSNRLGASISLEVARRNIGVSITKDRRMLKITQNKDKLLGVLMAKRLAKVTAATNEKGITFSVVEVDHEG